MLTLFYKVGPDPQRWWGMTRTSRDNGAHVERGDAAARRHPRPDQEQAGPARRRHAPEPDEHRVDGAAEQVAGALRAQHAMAARPGRSCSCPPPAPPIDAIQPSILIHPRAAGCRRWDGRVRACLRDLVERWRQDVVGGDADRAAEPERRHRRGDARRRPAPDRLQPHTQGADAVERRALARRQALGGGARARERAGRILVSRGDSRRPTAWSTSPTPGSASASSTW